jgi:hypothetical protein
MWFAVKRIAPGCLEYSDISPNFNILSFRFCCLGFVFFFNSNFKYFHFFKQDIVLIVDRMVGLRGFVTIVGGVQTLFQNAFLHNSKHAALKVTKAKILSLNLPNILCSILKY